MHLDTVTGQCAPGPTIFMFCFAISFFNFFFVSASIRTRLEILCLPYVGLHFDYNFVGYEKS